ncbi:MAG: hypothetical protein GEV05_20350 [Betaproteobacteria bacterium]|nr:hypothetical protein [Betaproteobacteria bacterium]
MRIVASQAGGGGDFISRLLAQGLTSAFGQQVVVDNRGGGVVAGRSGADGEGHTGGRDPREVRALQLEAGDEV